MCLKRKTLVVSIVAGLVLVSGLTAGLFISSANHSNKGKGGIGAAPPAPDTTEQIKAPASTPFKPESILESPKPGTTTPGDNLKKTDEAPKPSPAPQKEMSFSAPKSSGPLTVLPWEDNAKFLAAKDQNGTTALLGAYCTVLHDPLPGEEDNVHLAADMLAGIVVKPEQTFSQNQMIGPYTAARGFKKGPTYAGGKLTTTIGGGVCKIASTLYNVAVLSNLQIVERRYHEMPVPYVPYGQDATVLYGNLDFKFKNDNLSPVLIWAGGIDNNLYIAFYGRIKTADVEWRHETSEVKKAPRILRTNSKLPKGTRRIVQEGMNGAVVKSWVIIKYRKGTIAEKFMGTSRYKPMPYIIETGG